MATVQKITPCLWFDTEGEEAARFYVGIFDNSRMGEVTHFGAAGPRPEGMVMTVTFELEGQEFLALNGGPEFSFSETISFQVNCASQEEIDRLWAALTDGGKEGPCGWLTDRFGVSWQICPTALMSDVLRDPDRGRGQRMMTAMFGMTKLDMAELQRAADAG